MAEINDNQCLNAQEVEYAIAMGLKGECESVTIRFQNRKIKILEVVKTQDTKRKLIDIIRENDYQEVVIKTTKQGKIVNIKSTRKIRLDNNTPSVKGALQADETTAYQRGCNTPQSCNAHQRKDQAHY